VFVKMMEKKKCFSWTQYQVERAAARKWAVNISKSSDLGEFVNDPVCVKGLSDLALTVNEQWASDECDVTIGVGQVACIVPGHDELEIYCEPCAVRRLGRVVQPR